MKLKISLLILALVQSSCSYKNNIKQVINEERKTIQITNETKIINADFLTPSEVWGQALGGMVGAILATSNNGIVDISHAEDPANGIKKEIAEILKSKYNLNIIDGGEDVISDSKSTSSILSEYKKGDLVLDVYSIINGKYYPFEDSKYRIFYNVFIKLIDRETESVIFKSYCTYDKKEKNKNTIEVISKNPKAVSIVLSKAKDFCLEKFKNEILKGRPSIYSSVINKLKSIN